MCPVPLLFIKAPSLHDNFVIVASRVVLISACLSAINSGFGSLDHCHEVCVSVCRCIIAQLLTITAWCGVATLFQSDPRTIRCATSNH